MPEKNTISKIALALYFVTPAAAVLCVERFVILSSAGKFDHFDVDYISYS